MPRGRSQRSPKIPPGGVREAALLILSRVEGGNARADILLEDWFPTFADSHRDRALLMQLVSGTLRQRGYLDWILRQLVRGEAATLPAPVRNVLRLSLFQLEFLTRVPPHAVINEGVTLARRYGHEGTARLVNAVLREFMRSGKNLPRPSMETDPVEAIAALLSHPAWMVRRWVERYGPQATEALCRAGNRVPPITLRPNRFRTTPADLARRLRQEGLHPEPGSVYPDALILRENLFLPGLKSYRQGLFQVQDEASCLIAPLLGARPGETVLDLCAGPGGKATHLAELVGEGGCVVAVDVSSRALGRVVENSVRLGRRNILPVVADGCRLAIGPVDRVLVDAPCSGLGVLARRADARWRRREEDIGRFRSLQLALLRRAAELVRPGGKVVYATCTIEPEENELVVEEILKEREDLLLVPVELPEAARGELKSADGYLRLLPHVHGCDGGFGACLLKRQRDMGEGD